MKSAPTRPVTACGRWLSIACAGLLLCAAGSVQAGQQGFGWDLMRPPTAERRVEVTTTLPHWAVLPRSARILASKGVEVTSVKSSAVTLENAKLGLLVGALRNEGGCLRDVVIRLQYTDENWRPLGDAIESEARVGRIEPGALIPYKFRLAGTSDFETPPSATIIQVSEAGRPVSDLLAWTDGTDESKPIPCASEPDVVSMSLEKHRATQSGYRLEGKVRVETGTVRPDAVALTVLLLDDAGEVLDVLTGVPDDGPSNSDGTMSAGEERRFRMFSPMPLGKSVKSTHVFVQTLTDAALSH